MRSTYAHDIFRQEFMSIYEKKMCIRDRDYSVHEIGITKQRKNNDVVLDALSIKGDSNIVPVIYLEPYYQAYTDGVRMDDILQKIADMYIMVKYFGGL